MYRVTAVIWEQNQLALPSMSAENTFQTRALAIRDDTNIFESDPGTLSQTGSDMDIAIRGDGYFMVKGAGAPSLTRRGDLNVNNDGF